MTRPNRKPDYKYGNAGACWFEEMIFEYYGYHYKMEVDAFGDLIYHDSAMKIQRLMNRARIAYESWYAEKILLGQ